MHAVYAHQPANRPGYRVAARYTHAAARLASRSAKWEADLPRLTVASNYYRLRSSTHDRERVGTRREITTQDRHESLRNYRKIQIHDLSRCSSLSKRMFLQARVSSDKLITGQSALLQRKHDNRDCARSRDI